MELVKQALEAPGVYVFGELLDMPNVQVRSMIIDDGNFTTIFQELENTPHSPHLTLLNMFAYGNYSTLLDQKDNMPELTDVMRRKLRLLTIVSSSSLSLSPVPSGQPGGDKQGVAVQPPAGRAGHLHHQGPGGPHH